MTPVLTYFDPKKEIILSVDASNFALGAAIMHGKNPIAYASVSLTETQKSYAQIEKELLAILFGCTKFHQYIYGSKVIVETDHKPLVSLFDRPLHKIPPRLQRFMLRLQCYNISIVYRPGRDLKIADTLSRAPLGNTALSELDEEITLHCDFVATYLEVPFAEIDVVREHSDKDETFSKIMTYVKEGWPKNRRSIEQDVVPYYRIKDEISVLKGVLMKNHQIIIPKSLRKIVLNRIHEGHMGVQRCQNLARQSVYWPNIYNDIDNVVSNCEVCLKHQNSNTRPELMSHEIVDIPWYKVGCDLFEFRGKMYLLVVDYYSKYVEIELLNAGYSAPHVILKLKSIFSRHGIPYIFMSDNGPPFNSKEFELFCKDWEMDHVTSSPYLARSNGLAERTVQTVKKILIKSLESNSDPYIALLHYRTTPKGDLPSPSELLMSRRLRTRVPIMKNNLKPKLVDTAKYKNELKSRLAKCTEYYNRKSKKYESVNEGDKILFKKTPSGCWLNGEIVDICKEPRSYVILDGNGSLFRRSLEHIRKTPGDNSSSNNTIPKETFENLEIEHKKQNNENAKEVVKENVETDCKDGHYVTRKGRIITKPRRLDL